MAFKDMVGQKVPSVTFRTRQGDNWVDVTTDELFGGKKVVLFSLPGAFTPTCSSTHLPRYNELCGEFKKLGVDDIICVSVNDTFVMNAWKADQECANITVIPDGNGEFTDGMGRLVGKENLGFGKRSWRYSMLVDNGVIVKIFDEPEKDGDPFEVSDADTMIKFLNPEWTDKPSVAIISKAGCQFCIKAKEALTARGVAYEELVLGRDVTTTAVRAMTGRETVPQVFIGGKHIGGSDDLEKYLTSGECVL
ncbi:glutathione peroxidase [Moraxella sp. K127]|uniref:Hybrid peroxiredoxin hyPrx5 n=1 Tax=Moraxella lacunata TaxID=477 RepID=A0A378TVF2_MORLA|nr:MULTISPECIES: glutathione peroxidase [Moraxella]MBE9590624.1 glutathione peroxidase [Moraxella sp. K127]STZ64244.1 Hybrid peroxiredoxin hyPrx5 [Moraxella lacunata]